MAKNVKLMLTESVDSLGIVGDVVNVRVGYARNFLLPRSLATTPSDEAIAAVAAKRAEAQRQVAELRKQREELIHKMAGAHITLVRSCNDLGHLYASITQQEIAAALAEAGFPGIKPRDVRLNQSIKRIDNYDIHIKFDSDLDEVIKLTVNPDRKLDLRHEEPAPAETPAGGEAAATEGEEKPEAAPEGKAKKGDKGEKGEAKAKGGDKGEAKAKSDKPAAPEAKGDKDKKPKKEGKPAGKDGAAGAEAPAEKKSTGGWGTPVSKPEDFDLPMMGRRKRR